MIAKVIYDLSLDREFDYRIPAALEGKVRIGSAVTVPCGHSMREGWVFDLAERSAYTKGELKEISDLSTRRAAIPEKLVELGRWMAEYYCCTQEQAIRSLLPAAVRSGKVRALTRRVYAIADPDAARRRLDECGKKEHGYHNRNKLHAKPFGGIRGISAAVILMINRLREHETHRRSDK